MLCRKFVIVLVKKKIVKITDKNQKTTTNQSTKFHKLQAIFGEKQPVNGITQNTKDINNLQNNMLSEKNNSRNSSLENLNQMNSENEVISPHISSFLIKIKFHIDLASQSVHETIGRGQKLA